MGYKEGPSRPLYTHSSPFNPLAISSLIEKQKFHNSNCPFASIQKKKSKMKFTTIVTILAYAAASVSALPHTGPKITKTKTVIVSVNKNAQSCGNGQATYCCFGKLSCSAIGE